MRHVITLFLLIIFLIQTPACSALEGRLEYSIPIEYKNLNQEELEQKAGFYYNLALKTQTLNDEMTSALNLYTILSNKSPENILYPIRLGVLYDILGQNRYAKSNFYKALGINSSSSEAYFCFGEYYYRRQMFKKALNMYIKAYKNGFERNYETVYKIGDIYEKFGDTQAALKYLNLASELSPNSQLDVKIQRVQNADTLNKTYYSNTRIHNIER